MRGVVAVAVALLVSLMSSGCFVADDDPGTDATDVEGGTATPSGSGTKTGTRSATGATTGSSSGAGGDGGPEATANLTASVTEGAAPLNVTFTVNGTGTAWFLSAGEAAIANGTSFPALVNHTFTDVGNSTVVLTVMGASANATANVTIAVLEGVAAGSLPFVYTFEGTATGASEPGLTGTRIYGDDIEHVFEVLPGTKQVHLLLTWSPFVPGATDLDLYVYDGSGSEAGRSACGNFGGVDPGLIFSCDRAGDEETTITEVSGPGAWKAVIAPFEAPSIDYKLTVTLS